MSDVPQFPALLSLIDDRSAALRDAAAAAPDLEARVPGCPDWTLRDLVVHLGEVQRFWAATVRAADAGGPPSPEAIGDRTPHGDLLDWFGESTRLLLAALREAGPDAPSWTWWGASDAPQTSGAVARHQVQEAAVHAYDAQETIGKPEPLPAAEAVDSMSEFLVVSLGVLGAWPHRPARVAFRAVEGPAWTVDLTPDGAKLSPAAGGAAVTTLHGSASDLVLALYKRIPLSRLRIDGDAEVARQLRDWTETE
ncbi:maleylpyruvate isomerase family mycothiol-dependent enzyme [Jidongwangia harbinensis]|uniref:maleylpyruvate isomerase family mycothiol-dependent enzyme n=1 Tax=Jidongwangia harbinensis TaxID=2878561 RepID=UPI001CD9F320|nr:maleylpyruvate isomerase family mycothiol-dependent enzyme [Jidongwangia harbinensis]MCA2212253.1 maleylpyruvate isomerase family mycothiol-dependent enzyme [Jidongwangia harbinensis]